MRGNGKSSHVAMIEADFCSLSRLLKGKRNPFSARKSFSFRYLENNLLLTFWELLNHFSPDLTHPYGSHKASAMGKF